MEYWGPRSFAKLDICTVLSDRISLTFTSGTSSKGTSLSLPEDGVYDITSCRLNVAANIHVPVMDSKQKYFNLLPNMGMCIVVSGALWCVKILRVLLAPPCLTGSRR